MECEHGVSGFARPRARTQTCLGGPPAPGPKRLPQAATAPAQCLTASPRPPPVHRTLPRAQQTGHRSPDSLHRFSTVQPVCLGARSPFVEPKGADPTTTTQRPAGLPTLSLRLKVRGTLALSLSLPPLFLLPPSTTVSKASTAGASLRCVGRVLVSLSHRLPRWPAPASLFRRQHALLLDTASALPSSPPAPNTTRRQTNPEKTHVLISPVTGE